jgi:hypothetical protein
VVWWVVGSVFAAIFVADYPRYAPAGYGSALLTGVVIGLLHLGWLAIFRSPAACWGLIIAKLCAIPITIGFGVFALAMGAMGADSGMESAAKEIHFLVPFCMALASLPTTLAALVGAVIGHFVGKARSTSRSGSSQASSTADGTPPPPWEN